MVKYFVGLDLGQASDYTALSVLERLQQGGKAIYHVRRLERIRGEKYTNIATKVFTLMTAKPLHGDSILIVDSTGVGSAVVDIIRAAGLKKLISIWIHGGDTVSHEGTSYKVPKRDLVSITKILLQGSQLRVAPELKLNSILQEELLNFNYKINPLTAHDSYGCWREGQHDDLTLSVAMACWYAERGPRAQPDLSILPPDPSEKIVPAWRIPGESVPTKFGSDNWFSEAAAHHQTQMGRRKS